MKTIIYINDGKNDKALKASINSLLYFASEDIKVIVVGKEIDHPQVINVKSEHKEKIDETSGVKMLSIAVSQMEPEEKSFILVPKNCFFTAPLRLANLKIPKVNTSGELCTKAPIQIYISAIAQLFTGQQLADFIEEYFTKNLSSFPCDILTFPKDSILTPVINPLTKSEKITEVVKQNRTYILTATDECLESVINTITQLIDEAAC